jgi:UDP-2,3-diacylglucosamine hydrolase
MPKLGLIAGRGSLPATIANGRDVFILGFEGMEPDEVQAHVITRIAKVSDTLNALRGANVSQLVLAGHMKRPNILTLKPDDEGKKLMMRLGKAIFSGDDALLSALIGYFEEQGFEILSTEDVLGDGILATSGALTTRVPSASEMDAIRLGVEAARALGAKDIGQAVIVQDGRVIAEEDKHGTDALIARAGGAGALLVKACKPQQERRVDLPTIGPKTIEAIAAKGFAGVAVEAGKTLLLEREKTLATANEKGVFVYGA